MRSNRSPSGSARSVGHRAGADRCGTEKTSAGEPTVDERGAVSKTMLANVNIPQMGADVPADITPQIRMEWLDSANWRLPSGKALAEFALQAGFLAPLLFGADRFGKPAVKTGMALRGVAPDRAKNFGKQEGR